MTKLKQGTLLRAVFDEHVAVVYAADGETTMVDDIEYNTGSIAVFLSYDDQSEYTIWGKNDLAIVLLGDVKCSVVLADFKRIRKTKQ